VTRSRRILVAVEDRQSFLRVSCRWVGRIVRGALAAQRIASAEIGVILLADRSMARLNARWLGHEGATDVITFPLGGPEEPGCDRLRGDIAVSVETAAREATRLGWQTRQELAYYLVHGLLHLTGHDDRTPDARRRMRRREREVMTRLGLPEPPHP
jgi:probable rRNA maturation factor